MIRTTSKYETINLGSNGPIVGWSYSDTSVVTYLCPDLLAYEDIGAADNLRGRVIRIFFWIMRLWK